MAAEGDLGVEIGLDVAAVVSEEELKESWKLQVDWKGSVGEGEEAACLPRQPSAAEKRFGVVVDWTWNCGTVMLIAGAVLISIVTLTVKLLQYRAPLFQLIVVRSTVSCLVLMTWARLHNVSPLGPRSIWPWLVSRGASGAISMSLTFASLYLIPLGDTVVLLSSHPAWTAAACWLLRLESTNCMMMCGFMICTLGVVLVSHPPILFGGHNEWGIARIGGVSMGLGGAIFATVSFLLVSKIGTDAPAFTMTFWFQLCALCTSLPLMLTNFPSRMVWDLEFKDILLLGILSIASLFSQTFVNRGLQIVAPSKGAIILTTQMVFAHIWGVLLLDESLTLEGAGGMLLIAFGVVLVSKGSEVMESLRELAMEDVARWSWDRMATALSARYTRLNEVELSPGEQLAMLYG